MSSAHNWGPKRAAAYDARARRLFPAYEELHAQVASSAARLIPSGARVLVIGAGTGQDALRLADIGFEVTAIDPSEDMLAVARAKAMGQPRITLHDARVEDLSAHETFGAAVSVLVLHFLPDDGAKERFLREACIRCEPGGSLILADLTGEPGEPGFEGQLEEWLAHIEREFTAEEFEKDRVAIREGLHFVSAARHEELFESAGWSKPELVWQDRLMTLWTADKLRPSR